MLLFAIIVTIYILAFRPLTNGKQHEHVTAINHPKSAVTPAEFRAVEGTGLVEPRTELLRLATRTGGVIETCLAESGKPVKKGDTLAIFDASLERAQLVVAEANLKLARMEAAKVEAGVNPKKLDYERTVLRTLAHKLAFAERQFLRIQHAKNRNAASDEDLDIRENERQLAEMLLAEQQTSIDYYECFVTPQDRALVIARINLAEAALVEARDRVERMKLKAPADGTVLRWLKREGEGVSSVAPEPLLLFGDVSRLTVRAEIDERSAGWIREGMRAKIYGGNLDNLEWYGEVESVENVMGAKTVFTQAASERKDINVLEAVILMPETFRGPVGLRVDVRISAD